MLNKDLVKQLAKKIDNMVDWVKITGKPLLGRILEAADNWVLPNGLQYLNENYAEHIPEKFQDDVEAVITKFVNDDYTGILDLIPGVIDDLANIPFLDDDLEAKFIQVNFESILKLIEYIAQKRK